MNSVANQSAQDGGFAIKKILPIVKALIVGYVFSLLCFVILSFIMLYTNMSQGMTRPIVLAISLIAMLLSGFVAAKQYDAKGIIVGGFTGLLYMCGLYIVALISFSEVPFNMNVIIRFLYSFVAGAAGGVVGKNMSSMKRR